MVRPKYEVIIPVNLNHITAAVIDPKRSRIVYEGPARSYVSNFLESFRAILLGTTGASRNLIITGAATMPNQPVALDTTGATGLDRRGLLVGSSAAASAVSDTDLKTRITADITNSSMSYPNATLTSSNKYFDCMRTITATGNVTINEVALCSRNDSGSNPHMMVRDALAAPVVLVNTEANVFRYRLHFTNMWPAAWTYFYYGFTGVSASTPNTGGTSRAANGYMTSLGGNAAADEWGYGTIIGSSETAPAWDAYYLVDSHVTADFSSTAQSTGSVVEDAPDAYIDTSRDFVNISSPPVSKVVRQCALYLRFNAANNFMFHAGTLPVATTVAAGEGIRITYRFMVTH